MLKGSRRSGSATRMMQLRRGVVLVGGSAEGRRDASCYKSARSRVTWKGLTHAQTLILIGSMTSPGFCRRVFDLCNCSPPRSLFTLLLTFAASYEITSHASH